MLNRAQIDVSSACTPWGNCVLWYNFKCWWAEPWPAGSRLLISFPVCSASYFPLELKYVLLNLNPDVSAADVQNKLVAKDNEIQSLHSKLTDMMLSKQQLEQRMLQLIENEQKRASKEDSMQLRVQVLLTDLFFFPLCVCGNSNNLELLL